MQVIFHFFINGLFHKWSFVVFLLFQEVLARLFPGALIEMVTKHTKQDWGGLQHLLVITT